MSNPAIVKAVSAMRRKGTTATTASRAIASFGMPKTTQLDSSWAHCHDFIIPNFTEHKPNSLSILTGNACRCGEVLNRPFHSCDPIFRS